MTRIKNMAKLGMIGSKYATCQVPVCTSCLYGKATKKKWKHSNENQKHIKITKTITFKRFKKAIVFLRKEEVLVNLESWTWILDPEPGPWAPIPGSRILNPESMDPDAGNPWCSKVPINDRLHKVIISLDVYAPLEQFKCLINIRFYKVSRNSLSQESYTDRT